MVIQTREIKTMVDLISFQLKKSFVSSSILLTYGIIKQIMTGTSGNRLSICPLRSPPPKFLLTSPVPRSIDTLAELILNFLGQITLETSNYLFTNSKGNLYTRNPTVAIHQLIIKKGNSHHMSCCCLA